jgi:prolipoprotein diacylglyceryltransferase
MFIAFFGFSFVVWKRGRELHFDEEDLFDAVFIILFWFLVGARVGYVIANWNAFSENLWSMFNILGRPGMMYYSGLVFGMIATYIRAKRNNWDVYSFGDVLASGTALFLGFLHGGMFLNGSGVGIETESVLGVQFIGLLEKRFPVQLIDMLLYFALFGLLWWLENKYRTFSWYKGKKSEANSGFLLAVFFMGHGLIGFLTMWLKPPQLVYGIRWDWLFYLGLIIFGFIILLKRSDWHLKDLKLFKAKTS